MHDALEALSCEHRLNEAASNTPDAHAGPGVPDAQAPPRSVELLRHQPRMQQPAQQETILLAQQT